MAEASFLPQNLSFMAKSMAGYSRNRFRLETTSADSATAGRIITVNLPENSLIDTQSFAWWLNINTSNGAGAEYKDSAGADCNAVGVLPADIQSIIRNVEVYINGVQVQQGTSEYNTIARVLKIGRGNVPNDRSKERVVNHSFISEPGLGGAGTSNAKIDDLSVCVDKWYGFLNECSTRFLPTDLLGAIQVRITLADNSIISPYGYVTAGEGLAVSYQGDSNQISTFAYTVDEMYFTVDTITIDPMYSMAVRDMLQREQFIPINFKEYYSFALEGQTGTSYTNRFSLSATSIDKMYAVQRPSTYSSLGYPAVDLGASNLGNRYVANHFAFPLYDSESGAKNGTLRYNWSINNVKHPQYQARALEAARDLSFVNDKLHDKTVGHLVGDISAYKTGFGVVPLTLCHPDQPVSVQSGYNSKGINTQLTFEMSGLSNVPSSYQSLVIVETTPQLRVAQGKSLAVAH